MKWYDINKYVYSAGGIGAIGIIIMITLLGNVNVEYTNFPECINGTECYAKFLVSLNKSSYWTQVCFNIDENVQVPQIYKKSTYGRTLWINTSMNGFVRTEPKIPNKLMISTIKSNSIAISPDGLYLRNIQTGDCITKTKNSSLYVQAQKPMFRNVTWKMDLFNIDPEWESAYINLTTKCVSYQAETVEDECYKVEKFYPVSCAASCLTYANGTKYKKIKYNETICSYKGVCDKTTPIFIVAGKEIDTIKELNLNCKYQSTDLIECDDCSDGDCNGICSDGESCAIFSVNFQNKEFKDYHKTEIENKIKEKGIIDE